jgi:phenylacetate-CoA ligase
MGDYYDTLETRSTADRMADFTAKISAHVRTLKQDIPYYAARLADVDTSAIQSMDDFATIPVTRKSDLTTLQETSPPFGGLVHPDLGIGRIFQSPGPIHEPEGTNIGYWRMARALYAAGFRKGEKVHNSFSYHFTPGGWIFDDGCRELGCPVLPAGVGQTELQARAIAMLQTPNYVGTPSFLKLLLLKAQELSLDISCLKRALVSGEALPPSLRQEIQDLGVTVYQCYATADLGLIAYESPDQTGAVDGMVIDENIILEIVRPGTNIPLPDGEVGEVVVTTFTPEYPLLRFGTGDMSKILPGQSACGRTNRRIAGWMGRADQTTKVKGMFVHPKQVQDVIDRHIGLHKARLVITSQNNIDKMTLKAEGTGAEDDIAATLQHVLKLKGAVEIVADGTLPNDGIIIEDARTYE